MKIALNGLGRIGTSFLRALLADENACECLELVGINVGPAGDEHLVEALRYDTVMGAYTDTIQYENGMLSIGPYTVPVYTERSADQLPWKELGVSWVVDCSGVYTTRKKALSHCSAGAENVLVSAPVMDADAIIVPGTNDDDYDGSQQVVSLGSCTTNALVSLVTILYDATDVSSIMASTVHAYTNSQTLVDEIGNSAPRRRRAAAENIVPTTSGANKLVEVIFTQLKDAVNVLAYRVPVACGSIVDVVWQSATSVSQERVMRAVQHNHERAPHVFRVTHRPVVSSDIVGDPASVIVDMELMVCYGTYGRIAGWYDNEWGYSCRLKEFLCERAAKA